ncbi:MAG TPA: SCO family protein [Thermoanaerobaculia bacterium]|nr:SCO family protein [Thermoanaerobaculia bacterium]
MSAQFDASTAEETIGAWVSSGPAAEELLPLLPERHPLYAGRSTNETARIRGFILAAFERAGLPDGAVEYALEELESGLDPYLVAAAARALRGARPDPRYVPFLRKAQHNVRYHDVPVTFEAYKPRWPFAQATSALEELRATLAWLGADDAGVGDCCGVPSPPARTRKTVDPRIELEDQDGRAVRFGDFFRGKVSVVAFFYTRCDNPEKCSLTVAKLARLQEAIATGPLRGQVRVAGITYDPLYDLPQRMKHFGENRGLRFDDDVRLFRTAGDFDELRAGLELGVNFAGTLVNRHRIELFVHDASGEVVATFSRLLWDVDAVLAELRSLLAPPPPRRRLPALMAAIPALLLAILPKCPLCLGAYLTAFGLGGMQAVLRSPWTIALSLVLLAVHVWFVARRSRQLQAVAPLALALAGTAALLAGSILGNVRPVAIGGAVALVAASLLGAEGRAQRAEGRRASRSSSGFCALRSALLASQNVGRGVSPPPWGRRRADAHALRN